MKPAALIADSSGIQCGSSRSSISLAISDDQELGDHTLPAPYGICGHATGCASSCLVAAPTGMMYEVTSSSCSVALSF